MRADTVRLLFIGDIMGIPGRAIFKKYARELKKKYAAHALIVNGENSAYDGRGITPRIVEFLKEYGAQLVTSGNHIFAKRDIYPYLTAYKDLLRPANFPASCPGTGVSTFTIDSCTIGVINVQGRVFMKEHLACPFRTAESAVMFLKQKADVIIVDMHAEVSSEKVGLAFFLDGQVSAVLGTHTHVATADERILSGGTAFITDVGMAGAVDSMIGMKKAPLIQSLLSQMPVKFEVETEGAIHLNGVLLEIEKSTGKALSIERIRVVDSSLDLQDPELKDK